MRFPLDSSAVELPARPADSVLDLATSAPMTEINGSTLLLTTRQVAGALSIGRTKVYELINAGELRSVRIGGLRRILRSDLEAFVIGLNS